MKAVIQKLLSGCILTAGILMGSASTANANDGYLVLNTFAYHFENFNDREAFTPGVGWEYSPSNKIGWHVGTLSDSFGYQSSYGGLNYATGSIFNNRMRFLLGATILHKQFRANGDPETKIVPLPAVEFRLTNRAVLNLSGSPQVDYRDHRNNAVLFFQLKLDLQ